MKCVYLSRQFSDNIDKRCRGFIWGHGDLHRRLHLIYWPLVCKPKKESGIGMRSIQPINTFFMIKSVGICAHRKTLGFVQSISVMLIYYSYF
uniref:Ribonuclease H protein At1g65750 family n=1 Tax=Cajanus cajan TaxID=3821 RepID=A0A151TYH7_CAJCA|nr:Putative ribonuclease H protein At1g65750 family [Cajanus cajan]